jgi:hypothetical protein
MEKERERIGKDVKRLGDEGPCCAEDGLSGIIKTNFVYM